MSVEIHIKKAGLQTLIQDGGRMGFQAVGVSEAGAMDRFAAMLANRLVGNRLDGPVLELTLMGPVIEFQGRCQIALTGADLSPSIDGGRVEMHETIEVGAGSVLRFGRPEYGCRTYLGVGGKWVVDAFLGSKSPVFSGSKVFNNNSVIKNNTYLKLKPTFIQKRSCTSPYPDFSVACPDIRVLPGPEFEEFSRENIARFFSQIYTLANDSNRMGYRINPPLPEFHPNREMISSGIVPGTIQISNAGQPLILMADAQTSGGYFRIANVISADMGKLAQLKPGDSFRFVLANPTEALQALEEQKKFLELI